MEKSSDVELEKHFFIVSTGAVFGKNKILTSANLKRFLLRFAFNLMAANCFSTALIFCNAEINFVSAEAVDIFYRSLANYLSGKRRSNSFSFSRTTAAFSRESVSATLCVFQIPLSVSYTKCMATLILPLCLIQQNLK